MPQNHSLCTQFHIKHHHRHRDEVGNDADPDDDYEDDGNNACHQICHSKIYGKNNIQKNADHSFEFCPRSQGPLKKSLTLNQRKQSKNVASEEMFLFFQVNHDTHVCGKYIEMTGYFITGDWYFLEIQCHGSDFKCQENRQVIFIKIIPFEILLLSI